MTSLGTIVVAGSPLLAGVPNFTTDDNTNDALASGATLLAKWQDGRNAIASKGRVVSVTASVYDGEISPESAAAQLAVDAGNTLGPHTLTVSKAGTGSGTVTSTPAGIACGTTCAFNYPYGTAVTLTATPAPDPRLRAGAAVGAVGHRPARSR